MLIAGLLLIIIFVCVAMLWREGLWSNAITLFNVIFAALIASSLWEPIADQLDKSVPSGTYLWDLAALWFLFGIALVVMRAITDLISKVQVRFKLPVDWIGGILCAFLVGWTMVCFLSMTLHTAPLARHFMFGDFYDTPDDKLLVIAAPDHTWLGFIQQLSLGSLSGKNGFDPQGQFINTYAQRRASYERVDSILVD